ncbi:MAG: discoidin domain-containing protein [Phycisphaerales bacterium]|jgi:hypothetical protein
MKAFAFFNLPRLFLFARLALLLPLFAAIPAFAQPKVLDAMSAPGEWKTVTADGVTLSVTPDTHLGQPALRLDYHFVTGSGYGLIHRPLPLDLPGNYEFTFQVCGDGPVNNLEFKLLDDSGDSVWWINRRAFEWPSEWTRLINKKRAFEFAWGPAAGAPLKHLGAIEFAIASNTGGKGTVWLSNLAFRELPPPSEAPLAPVATTDTPNAASPELAVDHNLKTTWLATSPATLTLDYGRVAEVGGLLINWDKPPAAVTLTYSDDATTWTPTPTHTVCTSRSVITTPDLEARYIRLAFVAPAATSVSLHEVTSMGPEFSASPNATMQALAALSPQGWFPRYCNNVQNYWTIVGAPGDTVEALLAQDGQIELSRRGVTIEPFLDAGGTLVTWAQMKHTQSLRDGKLPIPTVVATAGILQLSITAFDEGAAPASALRAVYQLKNTGTRRQVGVLALCVRPFQVNPPSQRLNFEGGVSSVSDIAIEQTRGLSSVKVNGVARVWAPATETFGTTPFDGGDIVARLVGPASPTEAASHDPQGLASGVLKYAYELEPGQELSIPVLCPAHPDSPLETSPDDLAAWPKHLADAAARWQKLTGQVTFKLPSQDQWIADTFGAQLAYIDINRDGPAIQPGSRSYKRSWARDGSMTSAALLACGLSPIVRDWVDWFGAHQFDSGKVPCVVDSRGPDPVPEHDSHGQYIWAVADYYRFTHDKEFLAAHWPRVQKAVAYIKSLRAERMTPEFADPASPKHVFYGLVPESISHEGYSAKPMHSYWDDFFVLLGLKEAAFIAGEMHDDAAAKDYATLASDFRDTFYASARASTQAHNINYMPGCADLGDFDSTSTTIALWPCGEQSTMPQDLLHATFDRAWKNFEDRAKPGNPWDAYTPYELRHIGSYVRLGEPERAMAALRWFHQHQRPEAWHQWAEVVYQNPATPKFIGDMPHTWVGSDFLNSVLSMFVYERDGALVVFAGATREWASGKTPVAFNNILTPYGPVSGTFTPAGDSITITIRGGATPPGGFLVSPPPGFGDAPAANADRLVKFPAGSDRIVLRAIAR